MHRQSSYILLFVVTIYTSYILVMGCRISSNNLVSCVKIVATVAFGMGLDKRDIGAVRRKTVAHFDTQHEVVRVIT